MFNDPQQAEQPTDMFDESASAQGYGATQAESPLSNVMSQEYTTSHTNGMSPKKGMIIIVGVVVVLALLTGAGFGIYSSMSKKSADTASQQEPVETPSPESVVLPQTDQPLDGTESQTVSDSATTPVQPTDFTMPAPDATVPTQNIEVLDQTSSQVQPESSATQTQQDPLEALKSFDSDNDGLNDYDETYVYHTSSTSADTDGDTYTDADEIKNGYNPLGQGKMTEEQKIQWNRQ
ncbi:hypothetical protein HY620_02255 [Candidatus Uhrbacteria bacterium]|nr:hypothetical protein [Candidatus Uhrbacteria bacterium]